MRYHRTVVDRLERTLLISHWLRSPLPADEPQMIREALARSCSIFGSKRALLVSRFFYIRTIDPRSASVTGLTRDGVWYIENGEIQYPVRNFRFNQSIVLMLAPGNVDVIGVPERVASSEGGTDPLLVPALRLNAFNFTSQSDAI